MSKKRKKKKKSCDDCSDLKKELAKLKKQLATPIRPVVKAYHTQSGWCPHCKKRHRSRHQDQISNATGSAGAPCRIIEAALDIDFSLDLNQSLLHRIRRISI